jgi:DNA topoisomerase-2
VYNLADVYQLPIWSLTQERVDKLRQQMIDKKEEHDTLLKLSEKDLWCQDLDAFVEEWENQLKEDAEYEKDIRTKGRRASRKIGAGRTTKNRVKKEDEDFNPSKSKAASKASQAKAITKVEQKPHKGFLEMFQAKPKPKPLPSPDGADEAELSGMSDDDFAALAATKPSKETSRAPSEQSGPSNGRSKRAAAAAPKKWIEEYDEESESDDGKFLGDVGDMVKGISSGDATDTTGANGRVSLFAMSRASTSHGDRPSSSSGPSKPTVKPKASKAFELSDEDETNYEMLARSSPHKAAPAPKDNIDSFLSDDDDDLLAPVAKKAAAKPSAVKAPVKRGPKPKQPAAAAKKAAPAPPKPAALSPAAKAYAAKQTKKKAAKDAFSDDEDDEMDVDDSPPPKPAARGRPARAAATKAQEKKKPVYIDSDDDDEMDADDNDISAVVEDEQSEDDYDESF